MLVVAGMEVDDGVLVKFVGDEALLVLGGVSNDCWTIVGSGSESWIKVVGCGGELLLVVAMGLMEMVEWMSAFPIKFKSDVWVG